jgi:hypothetical protein
MMKQRAGWLIGVFLFSMIALVSFLTFVRPTHADDLIVGVSAGCATIQACIDTAVPGDNIIIPIGTYTESVTLNKAVSLLGTSAIDTRIGAVSGQRVLTVTGVTIDSGVVISGLTFQDGDVSGGNICAVGIITKTNCGGGVLITGKAGPSLSHLLIGDNSAFNGGGLFVDAGSVLPPLDYVTFYANSSILSGGGAYFAEPVVIGNGRFESNASLNNVAGGVRLTGDTIISNTADLGGGVAISSTFDGATPNYVVNVLLARNQATSASDALYHNLNRTLNIIHTTVASPTQTANQAIYVVTGTVNVTNTIIASHSIGIEVAGDGVATANYVNYFGNSTNEIGLSGSNLTMGDPLFLDIFADDYRLWVGSASLDNGVDAGITVDIMGLPRPTGDGFDLGAHEGAYKPSPPPLSVYIPAILSQPFAK